MHSVSFSGDGNRVCWVGHDSSLTVADAGKEMAKTQLKTEYLPFTAVTWVSLNSLVAVGHGCCPMLYSVDDMGKLTFVTKLDVAQKKESGSLSAMKKFQSLDRTARSDQSDTTLATIHQNTITGVAIYSGDKANCSSISTCGADSQLVIWNFKLLEQSVADLRLT